MSKQLYNWGESSSEDESGNEIDNSADLDACMGKDIDDWDDSTCKIVKSKNQKRKRNKMYQKTKYDNGTITKLTKGQNIVSMHHKTKTNSNSNYYDIIGYRYNELKSPEKIIIKSKTGKEILFAVEFYIVELNDGITVNMYNIKKECLYILKKYTTYLTSKGFVIRSYKTKKYGKKMYIYSYDDNIIFHGYSTGENFELTFANNMTKESYSINNVHIYYNRENINGYVIVPLSFDE